MNHAGQLDPSFEPDKPVGYKTEVDPKADNRGRESWLWPQASTFRSSLAGPLVVVVDVDAIPTVPIEVLHDT